MKADLDYTINDFLDEFLVVCPRCEKPALVRKSPAIQFSCTACGLGEEYDARKYKFTTRWWTSIDPYFGHNLWLQADCCSQTLWAYNRRHLAFLQAYIAQKLRDVGPPGRRNLGNKLPNWMLLAKNRDEVLKQIERLLAKM